LTAVLAIAQFSNLLIFLVSTARTMPPQPRIIRTIYLLHIRKDGYLQPFYEDFLTESDARQSAEGRARSLGLPIIKLDWREDIKAQTTDGVFIAPIRRDEGQPLQPRVYT
jgi:hypothetical protein